MKKIYSCCICHKELPDAGHRLVYQKYMYRGYGHFINQNNFDFCEDCIKYFKKWIIKHKEVIKDGR